MKKIALIFLLTATAILCHAQSGGRIETGKIASRILGADKEYNIYLPAGYDTDNRYYPVLYLLHGAGGTRVAWIQEGNMKYILDHAIAEGRALPMIVVMPDASGEGKDHNGRHMGYFNMPGWNYEDFFFQEFMPYIEKSYRIKKEKASRAIAGLSMGGGGTAVYAQHHPELFGSACAMSGLVGDLTHSGAAKINPEFGRSAEANNPCEYLRQATEQQLDALRTVRWYVDCGDDDHLYESNVEFYLLMRKKNIPLQYRMRDGGHEWEYWQTSLQTILPFLSVGFAESTMQTEH